MSRHCASLDRGPRFEGLNALRHERQVLVRRYEDGGGCPLVVVKEARLPHNIAPFEEVLFDVDSGQDLRVVLGAPGGAGETAECLRTGHWRSRHGSPRQP